ncbi:50S ribosome-binding GTPase [candidate division KSB1 bacterium]|nr:50S ribosome-binding GTPase [candidate division KSB1 bacterium]
MPANLTPQYLSAEERFKQAKDDRERMKSLKEMLANIPKHKGTEKLQADIKRKIARLKDDIDVKKTKGGHRFSYSIEKEGAAQIVVVGPPNVGKSCLVSSLTTTHLEVADYPYTTRIFQPAMMPYEDIQIQLVDLPPLSAEYCENWMSSIIRIADLMMLVIDANREDLLEQMETTLTILEGFKIKAVHANVQNESATMAGTELKTIVIANKIDLPNAEANFKILEEFYRERFELIPVSAQNKDHTNELTIKLVNLLQIIRVYSKRPGHDADFSRPFTFQKGSTLLEFARAVHKDFAENLKFARVWGAGVFDGQRINKDYILQDKDVIELHI